MLRVPQAGAIAYKCSCGTKIAGTPADARVFGATLSASKTTEMYQLLIRNAPFDRTNQLVAKDCPNCGLDYMVQIRVGDTEAVIYKCKCNYETNAAGVAATHAPGAAAGPAAAK